MVSGYLRGATPLSVNDSIHIPGFGNFQMSCIKTSTDPYLIEHVDRNEYPFDNKMQTKRKDNTEMILTADPEKQVPYAYFNIHDSRMNLELIMAIKKYC